MKFTSLLRTACLALPVAVCCFGIALPARADHAVVVGVNEYPKLAPGSNLEGCVNDAKNIEQSLQSRGFSVTLLTNAEASKNSIMGTLARMKTECKPGERFVFYFAGHGTIASDGASSLLPGDASEKSESSDLSRDELYQAIQAISARSRTVLLDSCFSGGLSRKGMGRKVKKTRYYRRAAAPARRDLESGDDSNNHIAGGAAIVYFTASLANQTSGEDDFEGVRGGVFTHFLTARLQKATTQTRWGEVQTNVTGEVADYMEQTQTPKLSPAEYANLPLFESSDAPPPAPEPAPKPEPKRSLWDDFNEDRSDPASLLLKMTPNLNTVKVGQKFSFEIQTGAQEGWLVLLEKDTDGKVYLLSPGGGKLDSAKVAPNSKLRLPSAGGRSYAADKPGVERVKAILFTSEENALALVTAFPQEGVEPRRMKRILEVESPRQSFYTFGLTFEVE